MKRKRFTLDQIETLSKSPHLSKCSEKSVSYAKEFKILAVKRYHEGLSPAQIFMEAGLDPAILGEGVPKKRLSKWRKIFAAKGADGLLMETRGSARIGRPRTKGITDADRIKRLEVEVAYLKAKNAFLVKLRASLGE